MDIHCWGISHKTAPVEIREKFFLTPVEREIFLSKVQHIPSVVEAFVISTCNRIEIYMCLLEGENFNPIPMIRDIKRLSVDFSTDSFFYHYTSQTAINHLFRVSTGLDSLVLGEKQILGQLKESIELARLHHTLGKHFNLLTNMAIRVGKIARNETTIDVGGSSISWAAVATAQQMGGSLQAKSALIVGAGKMGRLAASQLQAKGVEQIYIINRTFESAEELAKEFDAEAIPFWDIGEALKKVDFCFCSASAPHYIIDSDLIQKIMPYRAGKPLICIDVSMPRNIHPNVATVNGIKLATIDDLNGVVDEVLKTRQEAISQVERLIVQRQEMFLSKLNKVSQLQTVSF